MSSYQEIGFGVNDSTIGVKGKRFKAKEGETYRVSFVWWPGLEEGKPDLNAQTPRFLGAKRLYIAGVGYFISKSPEYERLAGSAAKMYVGTVICKWPTDNRGNLDKVKMRFRKMSLKWHPDKNMRRQKEAADVFTAVHAAYHFLTTNNFDYKRWAENFNIPPMQSLEDVLVMALKGADPYQIEMLLKKRGDYRPHAEFGINLSIPWSAGSKEDPNYHVHAGACH